MNYYELLVTFADGHEDRVFICGKTPKDAFEAYMSQFSHKPEVVAVSARKIGKWVALDLGDTEN